MHPPKLDVQPFASQVDYERVIDYFHNADDALLRAMGVERFPARASWLESLMSDFARPLAERRMYYLCWRFNDRPIGHCNVNPLVYGESAFVHLHLWLPIHRQGGLGLQFFRKSVRLFATHLQLRWIYCEPYADNPAPNRVLGKAGFRFVKRYRTTPGLLSFEQDVNRWELRVREE